MFVKDHHQGDFQKLYECAKVWCKSPWVWGASIESPRMMCLFLTPYCSAPPSPMTTSTFCKAALPQVGQKILSASCIWRLVIEHYRCVLSSCTYIWRRTILLLGQYECRSKFLPLWAAMLSLPFCTGGHFGTLEKLQAIAVPTDWHMIIQMWWKLRRLVVRVVKSSGFFKMDLRGFDPRTSSLLTRRTTDCSTKPICRCSIYYSIWTYVGDLIFIEHVQALLPLRWWL